MGWISVSPAACFKAVLCFVWAFAAAGFTGGALLSRVLKKSHQLTQAEVSLFSMVAGTLFVSLSVLVFGLLGWLYAPLLVIWISSCAFLAFRQRENLFQPAKWTFPDWRRNKMLFFALPPLALSWMMALAPPTTNDDLAYHLTDPKLFTLAHKVYPIEGMRETLWPYFTEMLYTLALMVQGTMLAHFFHWAFYVAIAVAIFALAKRFLNEETAMLSALIFLYTPTAFSQASCAYVDLPMAFFIFLSVYALLLFDKIDSKNAAILSGLCAGAGLSVKYLGLGSTAILGFLWLIRARRQWKLIVIFTTTALAVSAIWYLRSWIEIGNPVYPFFPAIFGDHGYHVRISEHSTGMGNGPLELIFFLWNATLHPDFFGGDLLGPFYLVFLPLLLFPGWNISKPGKVFIAFTGLFFIFLFKSSQHVRFFLSIFPFLAVGAGWAAWRAKQISPALKMTVRGVLLGFFILHALLFVYRSRQTWPVLSGRQSVSDYLMHNERSTRGYAFLDREVPPGARIFNSGEARRFYNSHAGMVFHTGPLVEKLAKQGISLQEYVLREKFDYLWLSSITEEGMGEFALRNGYEKIYEYTFREGAVAYDYTFYRLLRV